MINVFNLVILICIMLPNVIYALKVQDIKPVRKEREGFEWPGKEEKKVERTALEELLYAEDDYTIAERTEAELKKIDVDTSKKKARWRRLNLLIGLLETLARYICMILMIVPFGVLEFEFSNKENFIIYVFGNIILIVTYWLCWSKFFKKRTLKRAVGVSVLAAIIFLLTGLTLDHWWLCLSALLFGFCHVGIVLESVWEE